MWHEGLLYKLIFINHLPVRFQRVILNGLKSSWRLVLTGFPQCLILGTILFLVSINGLLNEIKSSPKLFANDTSLFTVAKDKNESANILNNDLLLISKWSYNWKVPFTPDPSNRLKKCYSQEKRKFKLVQQ